MEPSIIEVSFRWKRYYGVTSTNEGRHLIAHRTEDRAGHRERHLTGSSHDYQVGRWSTSRGAVRP